MEGGKKSLILEEIKRIENVPGFVYLIRNKDLFKIGITVSMQRRMKELKPDEVVAVKQAANMRGIEKLLHKRYKHQRIPQTEYFRLSSDEVSEAVLLLGGNAAAGYIPKESAKEEARELQQLANNKTQGLLLSKEVKELVDEAEDLLFNTVSLDRFYQEFPDQETGEVKTAIEWWRSGDLTPPVKIPMNARTIRACEECACRDDIFLGVAGAENDSEAAEEVMKVIDNFSLIFCWSYRNGYVTLDLDDKSVSSEDYMADFERRLVERGLWYTDESKSVYGVTLGSVAQERIQAKKKFAYKQKFGTSLDYILTTFIAIIFTNWLFWVSPVVVWRLSSLQTKKFQGKPKSSFYQAWFVIGVIVFIFQQFMNG